MRLFVALDVLQEIRGRVWGLMERLRPMCAGARWVRPEGIHVTLKFIGHAESAQCEAICRALEPVQSDAPVEMQFRGLGFFPNERRPRVMWCGVEGSPNLAHLAAEVDESLAALGVERERRAYSPHLTLARIDPEKMRRGEIEKLAEAARELAGAGFGAARESEFHLFESVTRPSGAEYKKLKSFALVKRPG